MLTEKGATPGNPLRAIVRFQAAVMILLVIAIILLSWQLRAITKDLTVATASAVTAETSLHDIESGQTKVTCQAAQP